MIDKTAIINKNAKVHSSVKIGPYTIVGPNVEIGENTEIQSHVSITGNTKIGKGNKIYPFVSINDPQDLKYNGEETSLVIGDNNKIREYVTINPGTIGGGGKTVIGNNCLFMISSHIAHDCVLGNDIVLTNQAALAGSVHVGDGAILGGYAIVHQFCSLGSYSFCAMGSAVNKDIPAYVKVRGNPAKPFGINVTGIKRLGYSKESIEALRSAYRSIYRKKLTVEEAIEELKGLRKEYEEVDLFLNSIEKSTRGISR